MIRKISMPRLSSHQTGKPTKITASGQPGRGCHTAGRVITRAGTTLVVPTVDALSLVSLAEVQSVTRTGRWSAPYVELRPLAERAERLERLSARVDGRVAAGRHVRRVLGIEVGQGLDARVLRELLGDAAEELLLAPRVAGGLQHRPLRQHQRLVGEVPLGVVVKAREPELLLPRGDLVHQGGVVLDVGLGE